MVGMCLSVVQYAEYKKYNETYLTELRHGLAPPGLLGCARRCQRYRVRNYRSTIIHDGSSEAHSAAEFSRILARDRDQARCHWLWLFTGSLPVLSLALPGPGSISGLD